MASKKSFIIVLIVVSAVVGLYFYFTSKREPVYDFIIAAKGNLIQEVSVTGKVKPAKSVELAFERSGRAGAVYGKIGDKVEAGKMLASLFNGELVSDLLKAEANLESEEAKLEELKKGTRPEEIKAAETVLADAEVELQNTKDKAEADLESDYSSALAATQTSVMRGKNTLAVLTDIQVAHFLSTDQNSLAVTDAKANAVYALLGAAGGGRYTAEQISVLSGGAFGTVQNAVLNPTHQNIDAALSKTANALQKIKNALDAVPIIGDLTSTEKTNLTNEKVYINAEITTISGKEQDIAVQKATNSSNIAAAETAVNAAKDDLAVKRAGYTPEQIAAQEAKVKSARAGVQNIQAQIAKTIIRSPIKGTITKQDVKVGEIASANAPLISVISEANFEIEANVPEADIAKVKIGDEARVTLDAYGNEVLFKAKVVAMDPAETIIEGVATYKTTLQFAKDDERVRSGMTANIDIETAKKENVILVPGRAIATKNNEKFVQILIGRRTEDVAVTFGLRGSDGNVEIISGINEGDKVVTGVKK